MCLVEVWTFVECGCRFDHHVPCHPNFFRYRSPAQARHSQIQPLPATPPPSRSADDGDFAWTDYTDSDGQVGTRQCSIRHIEHRVFREPICDDCLLEELGLKKVAEQVVESIESALGGEGWLLESKVEIQIGEDITTQDQHEVGPEDLLDDMPTPRVGTGFQSLGDGDADDEGEFEENFRGRSTRRSAIDITREQIKMAGSWSNWDLGSHNPVRNRLTAERSCGGRQTARSLVKKIKDAELKTFAVKAKRGLRLTIDRAKIVASRARSDTSRSPTKTEWDSESSTVNTPTVVTRVSSIFDSKGLRTVDPPGKVERRTVSQRLSRTSQGDLTALPAYGRADDDDNDVDPAVSNISEAQESDNTTPTSISSSAAYDLAQTSGDKWDDHLRNDLGERSSKHTKDLSSIPAGNKSDIHFDALDSGRLLLSTDTTPSTAPTTRTTSSGNWIPLSSHPRLDEELSGRYLDGGEDPRQLLSSTTTHSFASTASSLSSLEFTREISTVEMDRAIPDTARPSRHAHAHHPSVSSIASASTALDMSPQTSPPRLSPRTGTGQGVSLHPLATMLRVATPERPDWKARESSLGSPPLSGDCRVGLEGSPLQRSSTCGFVCVHEWDCCAICGGCVGEVRVVSCVCEGQQGCEGEGAVVRMMEGMEVCDRCAGAR